MFFFVVWCSFYRGVFVIGRAMFVSCCVMIVLLRGVRFRFVVIIVLWIFRVRAVERSILFEGCYFFLFGGCSALFVECARFNVMLVVVVGRPFVLWCARFCCGLFFLFWYVRFL